VLGLFLGPTVLPYVSAYSVIGMGAFAGAIIALFRRPPTSPGSSYAFVVVVWTIAMGCTVPISQYLAIYSGQPVTWLMFPVSLLVAAVGEDWLKLPVLDWIRNLKRLRGPEK
jgi:hypothetical protein